MNKYVVFRMTSLTVHHIQYIVNDVVVFYRIWGYFSIRSLALTILS